MNETDCMSCRARGGGDGDVTEYATATGVVVECRKCGFRLRREERDAIATYYENAAARAEMARDVAWVMALKQARFDGDWFAFTIAKRVLGPTWRDAVNAETDADVAAAIRAARGAS